MASSMQTTHMSLAEYLETSFRPDREYIDGAVRERNVGKWEHARVQALLAGWFMNHESVWGVMTSTEQRSRVAASRVRIPDLVVVKAGPQPPVLVDPPVLVVEILSPDDTYSDTEERASDYLAMGVETVWIIDPQNRTGRMCRANLWIGAERLLVEGSAIYVELADIFRDLDQPHPREI